MMLVFRAHAQEEQDRSATELFYSLIADFKPF